MITNARFTREATDELEVCWNGVNDGHDGDILCKERRTPEKSAGGPIRKSSTAASTCELVRAALPQTQKDAATFRELIAVTGCKASAVNSALHVLRRAGILDSEILPAAMGYRSRPPQRYWRRG